MHNEKMVKKRRTAANREEGEEEVSVVTGKRISGDNDGDEERRGI